MAPRCQVALTLLALAAGALAPAAGAQEATAPLLDSLLAANARDLSLENGVLSGEGAAFLLAEASRSQFLALGEEHNALEIPELTTALFPTLQQSAGYQYLAVEQDPAFRRWVFGFAAALYVGGMHRATYALNPGVAY